MMIEAKLSEVKSGDELYFFGGDPCLQGSYRKKEVKKDEYGLYVDCFEGKHYIGCHLTRGDDVLVGFMKDVEE